MNPKLVIALFFVTSGTVVAAAVYSAVEGPRHLGLGWSDGCDLDVTGATPVPESEHIVASASGGKWTATRTLTWSFPPQAAGQVHLCADTGGVRLEAGSADRIVVEAKVYGHATSEAAARRAAQEFHPEVRGLADAVWAWHPAGPRRMHHDVGATVGFKVLVPPQMLVEADLATDTGGVDVGAVRLSGLVAETDTGGIDLAPAFARGSITAGTDTGGIHAWFGALDDATMRLTADTGGVEVFVPTGDAHGYDVEADTDVGGVVIALPGMEDVDRADREHRHVRTRGFADRAVQVTIEARTDTGGVHVGAS